MADHIREDALLRISDALLDVGCCLNRFEVDSIQYLSWKSHTYLSNNSHSLPLRRLQMARFGGKRTFVSAWDPARGCVRFDGAEPGALQFALAAIKDSHVNDLTLYDPTGHPITEEEVAAIAAVAGTVKVANLSIHCRLTHLSPGTLYRLDFGFSSIEGLTLNRFNGYQLTDEHLRECGRKRMWRLYATTETAVAGPLAFSDEALLDYLLAPEPREVVLSVFSASPLFVQKLLSRAHTATDIRLEVKHLPLASQQLGGLRMTVNGGFAEYTETLENGVRVSLEFGRHPMSQHRFGRTADEEESEDKFRFILSK